MKLVTEYLEKAAEFERMADEATDAKLKANLNSQAEAYYKLAEVKAKKTGQPIPQRQPPKGD